MPYDVRRSGRCQASKPWAVIKRSDGKIMGCHETRGDAVQQLAALEASEAGRDNDKK